MPTEWRVIQTHPFSLAQYIVPGHYWELRSVICFCTFLIISWGEGRIKMYIVTELYPHLPEGFVSREEVQSLTFLTGRNQALHLVQCNKFHLVGAWPPLNDYSLHILFHCSWLCPLWKIFTPMVFIMQTQIFRSCTLFEEMSLSRAEASSNDNKKRN